MKKEEREKRTLLNPNTTPDEIINNHGYYDINHNWNSIITFPDKPGKIFRFRVEVIILNRNNEIYMVTYKNNTYRLPGGGVEKDRSYKYQVEKEAEEESGIRLGTIFNTEVSYFKYFNNKYGECDIHWDGTYTKVFVAYFKDWYFGKIKDSVRDNEMRYKGRFMPYEYAINILNPYHVKALQNYNNIIMMNKKKY